MGCIETRHRSERRRTACSSTIMNDEHAVAVVLSQRSVENANRLTMDSLQVACELGFVARKMRSVQGVLIPFGENGLRRHHSHCNDVQLKVSS
ncbi:hypothetical protein Rcae01_05170 [Novipirellula caenicola]|uniref:Uncharacterized protein n=1 Tax=Novipirellula caenicola TaxID=1536901 RepID=A0ABP9VX02_9BACT